MDVWISKLEKEKGAKISPVSKEEIISEHILEMEVKRMELNNRLEGIIYKMTKELPKISKEVSNQQNEIRNFKLVIENAREVVNSQNIKATSLQSLAILDRALERVKSSQLFLKDKDNWNTVSAEMESLFAAQDYDKASKRLIEAEKSYQLLLSNPNAKNIYERKTLLDSLRNRLLASIRVEVINILIINTQFSNTILQSNHFESKVLLKHFEKLESLSEARLILLEIKQPSIAALWPVGKDNHLILEEFECFFNDLFTKLKEECLPLFSSIFDNAGNTEIHQFVENLFSKVEPSMSLHLDNIEKEGKESSILFIIQLYHLCIKFGSQFEEHFLLPSMSHKYILPDFGKPLFDSFLPFQKKYEKLEKIYLDYKLRVEVFDIRNLMNFIAIIDLAKQRCLSFTFGLIKIDFEKLIDSFLIQVLEKAMQLLFSSGKAKLDEFHVYADNLKAAIEFTRNIESFWATTVPDLMKAPSSDFFSCKSSTAALKNIRRDFHIIDDTFACKSSAKANNFIVQWQERVLEGLLEPVDAALLDLEKLETWASISTISDVQFSLSPLNFITSIGEYMLTLPQAFEPYSQEDFYAFSLKTLPFIENELKCLEIHDGEDLIYEPIHIWIISSVRLIESKLLNAVLKIEKLSSNGLKQLLTDIRYFQNVMLAVDIEPQEKFIDLQYALNIDYESLILEILSSETVRKVGILNIVAKMRSSS